MKYRIIISGGGTGGHIFPAISIADSFKRRFPESEILFTGADNRMEMERVPAAGYRIVGLPVTGFDRSRLLNNAKTVKRLAESLIKARKIIKEFKPDIAVGVGGYASAPTLWMANMLGIPTVIQEQNSYAGVTNRLLGRGATRICVAYDRMERFFPAGKIVHTGNPVRTEIENASATRAEALDFFGLREEKKTLLVMGGSLGAKTINLSIRQGLEALAAQDIQVIWQTGRNFCGVPEELTKPGIRRYDFIGRMDYAYAAADLVISRAGAGTISELCLRGKPVALVPSPNVAEDHQTRNALALTEKGAAVLVRDCDAAEKLMDTVVGLINDEERLLSLSRNISTLGVHGSAERIVDEIAKILQKNTGKR